MSLRLTTSEGLQATTVRHYTKCCLYMRSSVDREEVRLLTLVLGRDLQRFSLLQMRSCWNGDAFAVGNDTNL